MLPDKLLTTAVVSYGATGEGVLTETFELFDFVNVMTYDGPDHGTMEQFENGLAYWQGRGLPPEKTVMGVPFYARPNEAIYRRLVEVDPQNAYLDSTEFNGAIVYYNGIPTIQTKTRLAMERAGANACTGWQPYNHICILPPAIMNFGKVIYDLAKPYRNKIGKLHFHHAFKTFERKAKRSADDSAFAQGRISHSFFSKFA